MADGKPASYPLGQSGREAQRLNGQHYALIENMGYAVHPRVLKSLPSRDARIAEMATGTGIFLLDFAKELPSCAMLEGFDISDASYPGPSERPKNVNFGVLDAKVPPPTELHGRYDVVFIRYINIAMTETDWARVACNVCQLLKPGGVLQWWEGCFRQLHYSSYGLPGVPPVAMLEGFTRAFAHRPQLDWAGQHLATCLAENGFQDVMQERASTDSKADTRRETTHLWIGATALVLKYDLMTKSGNDVAGEQELQDLVSRMRKETDEGAYARYDMHVWTAIKA